MVRAQNKHFCVMLAISLMVHLFVLTILFTVPKSDMPEGYKRVKIKLGTGKLKVADSMDSARKYTAYEPGAGAHDQPEVPGHSNLNAPEIEANPDIVSEKTKAADAESPEVSSSKEADQSADTGNKKTETPTEFKPQPEQVKKVEKQMAKKEPKAEEKTVQSEQSSAQESDDEESTIIGNSVAPSAEKLASYEQMLPLWLEKFKKYPPEAKVSGASGIGEIFIKIDRKGKILLSKIMKTTGTPALDKALVKMLADADPVLPVPLEYYPDKKTFSYKIAIEFERPKNDQ